MSGAWAAAFAGVAKIPMRVSPRYQAILTTVDDPRPECPMLCNDFLVLNTILREGESGKEARVWVIEHEDQCPQARPPEAKP